MNMKTLYYTVHNFVKEFGEGQTMYLYSIEDNIPTLISELERNLDVGWTELEELEMHVEGWGDSTTFLFEKL